ncbi:transposable element Tcb2 transposase [Trichonephila clavipes]|nr:transposable element Tcb2 transposase [Trichonephila clavipes]
MRSPHNRLPLDWCHAPGNWTAAEWNQVVFRDESRFNSTVMTIVFVCEDPVNNASILPLLHSDTPVTQLVPFFNKTMLCLTRQDCLRTVTPLLWPARSPDFSPMEHIWDDLGWRVGHPTILNELEARLQQIWNEMSQDIIQNLYATIPDRIASFIRARGGSTRSEKLQKSSKTAFAECGLSVDSTWQRRGHSSLNGCVAALFIDTGKLLDLEIMSKFCRICNRLKNSKSPVGQACSCNHQGSTSSMESVDAYRTFKRSCTTRNVKYVHFYGNGDS